MLHADLFQLCFVFLHMLQRKRSDVYVLRLGGGILARAATEYDDVQQAVAHQAVAAVDAADGFARHEQVFNGGRRLDHVRELAVGIGDPVGP